MLIAIDGPAASGKGTLAKRLAARYQLAHLDTGALYRGIGLLVLRAGEDPTNPDAALRAVDSLPNLTMGDPDLRTLQTGEAASKVAAIGPVRERLLAFQRHFAADPPYGLRGAVLEGRDIGTVICPNAPLKIFITADLAVRARRRLADLNAQAIDADFDAVQEDLANRDRRDAGRTDAPLKQADDAVLLDTSELSIDTVVSRAEGLVDALWRGL
ncbi:MAG: (d)CMP kinase [Pseudomonadota bacterium]